VLEVEFDQYPWEFHRQLKQAGMMPESAYEASWRFLLLLMMAKEWAETGEPTTRAKAAGFLEKVLPNPTRGFWASLLARLRNPAKIGMPGVGVAGAGNVSLGSVELGKEDASYAVSVMSMHFSALGLLAAEVYPTHPLVVKVDRLDDGWDATPDSQSLIVGQLKAARGINQQWQRDDKPAPIITFLRSDIYEAVKFNDKNKMATSIERLEWPDDRLLDVLNRRIVASLAVKPEDAWGAVFSEAEMRQRAKPRSYFIRRTMGRPRDVIAFAIHCRDVALEKQHPRVETADIYEAEDRYSQHLLNELSDELHKQLPELDSLLDTLRDVGRMTFTSADWAEAAKRRAADVTDGAAKEQLRELYEASVIGVARIGGSKGGSQHVFNYSAPHAKPDFSGKIYVHPGLKKGLQLKEGQSGEQVEDDDSPVG